MKRFLVATLITLGIIGTSIIPAHAINIPGCGEFIIFAKNGILMEQGPTDLTGDIMNLSLGASPGDTVFVGAHNVIKGTVSADRIVLGTDSVVDVCVANTIQNNGGTCKNLPNLPLGTSAGPGFAPAAACTQAPFPGGLATPVFPAQCLPGTAIVVPAGASQTLAPGCYASVRLNGDSTLTLQATKRYDIKGELRLITGASLKSDTQGSSAIVVVKGFVITEAQTFLTDLALTALSGPTNNVHFGNGTLLTNVVAISATGEIHIHTGS